MHFSTTTDGLIDASLGPDFPLFDQALADSVSSRPPRGYPQDGPSTYWIDRAEQGALDAASAGDERPFVSGNITILFVSDGNVIANYDYAQEEGEAGESISLDEFLSIMRQWRARVLNPQ